jgi:hypothetical protein
MLISRDISRINIAWITCLLLSAPLAEAQKLTWNRIWGVSNTYTCADAVALDASNNCFVAGYTLGAFDSQTNAGAKDAFLSKIDRYGSRQWTRIWGSPTNETVTGVTVDRKGCVYVAGHTEGAFHGETNTLAGKTDFFLTKWSNDGVWLWTRIWGSASNDLSAGVVVNSVDWPHVAGSTMGGFGGQTNTKSGRYDFCLTAFSTNGVINPGTIAIWGSTNSDDCIDVAINTSDILFLVGTVGVGIFEGITNTFNYNRPAISACYLDGSRAWSAVWGATNKHNYVRSVWAGSSIYVAGWTFGNFDGQTNTPGGNSDLFISQFTTGGTRSWTRIYGSNSWEEAYGVAGDSAGNAYVTGQTGASLLDGQPSAGGSDYFLIKYDSSGARQWTRLWGSGSDDTGGMGLAVDPAVNVFVCGYTYGSFGGQLNPGQAAYRDCATLSRWRMGTNTYPQPVISKPLAGREFIANEQVDCIGYALDADDGWVTNLTWSLGAGSGSGPTCTVTAAVAAGVQNMTATAIDSESGSKSASAALTIQAAGSEGLPLTWEQSYWPVEPSGGGTNDSDGDGLDNWGEWMAGSNPTNPGSAFRVETPLASPDPSRLVLQWASQSNREYTVRAATNLVSGFSPLTNLMGAAPVMIYTTPPALHPQNFYSIEVGR